MKLRVNQVLVIFLFQNVMGTKSMKRKLTDNVSSYKTFDEISILLTLKEKNDCTQK